MLDEPFVGLDPGQRLHLPASSSLGERAAVLVSTYLRSAALALAVVLARLTPERQGGVVVAPALVLGVVLAGLACRPLLLTGPADPRWADAHRVLAASAVLSALVYAAATVGPDARWRRAARRRRSANPAG